eukprot:4310417-Ditylum_brightwellii.AAC.1
MEPNKGKELLLQIPHDVALQATTPALIAATETSTLHHVDDVLLFFDCSEKANPGLQRIILMMMMMAKCQL